MHRSDTKLRRFQETMNIYLFVVLLFCLNFTFSLDVTRNHDGDTLKCDTKIDCLSSGAVNTNENTCFCDEGTYFLLVNKLSCIKDNGKTAGIPLSFSDKYRAVVSNEFGRYISACCFYRVSQRNFWFASFFALLWFTYAMKFHRSPYIWH